MKFQDQIFFSKFQDIFVAFTRLKTQKMHTLFTNQTETEMMSASKINILRQTCSKQVSKPKVLITTESSYEVTKYRIKAMP